MVEGEVVIEAGRRGLSAEKISAEEEETEGGVAEGNPEKKGIAPRYLTLLPFPGRPLAGSRTWNCRRGSPPIASSTDDSCGFNVTSQSTYQVKGRWPKGPETPCVDRTFLLLRRHQRGRQTKQLEHISPCTTRSANR